MPRGKSLWDDKSFCIKFWVKFHFNLGRRAWNNLVIYSSIILWLKQNHWRGLTFEEVAAASGRYRVITLTVWSWNKKSELLCFPKKLMQPFTCDKRFAQGSKIRHWSRCVSCLCRWYFKSSKTILMLTPRGFFFFSSQIWAMLQCDYQSMRGQWE